MDSMKKPRALEPPSNNNNNNNEERSRALARQTTQENHGNTDSIHEPSSGATSERESLATSTRYAGMSESMSRLKRVERRDHVPSSPNSGTSSFDTSTTTNISPQPPLSGRRSNSMSRLKQMDVPTKASQSLTEGCQDATTKTNQVHEEIGVLERKQGWNNRTAGLPERQHLTNNSSRRQLPPTKPGAYAIDSPFRDPVQDSVELSLEVGDELDEGREAQEIQIEAVVQSAIEDTTTTGPGNDRRKNCAVVLFGALILVIATGVAVVVVISQTASDGKSAINEQTQAPAGEMVDRFEYCFGRHSISLIQLNRWLARRPKPFDTFVDIELCADSEFLVNNMDVNAREWEFPLFGVRPPINAQSNMRIRCGQHGLLEDRCIISGRNGGDVLMLNSKDTSNEVAARNVTIEGITFQNTFNYLLMMYNGGFITFRKCLFRSRGGTLPILVDYQREVADTQITQTVIFEGCIFQGLKIGPRANSIGPPDMPLTANYDDTATVVLASNSANTVIFRNCIFQDINVEGPRDGHIITSLGAEVHVENCCFYGLDGTGDSPILLAGASQRSILNDGFNNFVEGPWKCGFVRRLEAQTTTCGDATVSSVCLSNAFNASQNIYW